MKVIALFSFFIAVSSIISKMFFSKLGEVQCVNVLNVRL